jgi:hypothetical protein
VTGSPPEFLTLTNVLMCSPGEAVSSILTGEMVSAYGGVLSCVPAMLAGSAAEAVTAAHRSVAAHKPPIMLNCRRTTPSFFSECERAGLPVRRQPSSS